MLTFKSSSATHVGMVRKLNEDSFISRDEVGLWAVADGMGGHQAGDVASQQVVKSLATVPNCPDIVALLDATRTAIRAANSALLGMAGQYDRDRVPGSTVVALVMHGDQAAVTWAGDSRIYRLRNGRAEQVSRDHSHVQELLNQHLISPEEAEHHPMSNVITRAIGIEDPVELETLKLELQEGDRFLLCSDGLSRLVSLEEIAQLLQTRQLEEAVHSLLHTALVRGAPDNVTIVSVECQSDVDPVDDDDDDDDRTVTQVF